MEFKELIEDFAARHGIDGLTVENGVSALDIDGYIVTLVEDAGALVLNAEIGEPPVEGRAEFAEALLAANFGADVIFAKNDENSLYTLSRRLALAPLDGEALDAALEDFVNQTETWRKFLEDYRPVAESAAAAKKDEEPSFGVGGFIQV